MAESVPAEVLDAARNTLGAAVVAAKSLPTDLAKDLLQHCNEAFVHSLRYVAYIDCVLALILSVLVAVILKDTKHQSGGH
jgi:DHA2 family multidrug resistance protein-like MFS transporter